MKTVKRFFALTMLAIISLPAFLMAQDKGTYIDNLGVQDSSYMEQDLPAAAGQSSNSTTIIIVIVVVVVVAVAAFLFMKKKKKQYHLTFENAAGNPGHNKSGFSIGKNKGHSYL